MNEISGKSIQLSHQQVVVEGIPLHVAVGGDVEKPALLFLHGWPESWAAFEAIMLSLGRQVRVAAVDLPGIGASETQPTAYDKRSLATYVRGVIHGLGLQDVTLVGHDVGGQIVYAYLHAYPGDLQRAVIMNVAAQG